MAAEAGQAAELAHAHGALAAMHSLARADCCNDPAEQGQSGKLCKMGKDCLAAPAMALPPIGPMLERIATSAPVLALAAGPGKMRLASIWRPPSAFL